MRVFQPQDAKNAYVSGMTWQVLDPMGDSFLGHQQIPKLIEEGGRFCVRYKNIGEVNMGVLKNFEDPLYENKKVFSFASLVATHEDFGGKTCLVLIQNETREEPQGLAVGLVAGNVVIDQVFDIVDVNAVYEEFVFLCSKSGRSFFVAGDLCPIGVDIAPAHHVNCAQVIGNKTAKKIKLEELKNERFALTVLGLVFVLILLSCAYEAWSWYDGKKIAEIDQIKLAQNSPETIYSQSVSLVLSKKFLIPHASGEQFATEIGNFPANLGGWRLSSIWCEALACKAKWHSVGGTYESFKARLQPDWGKLKLGGSDKDSLGDLQSLQHTFELQTPLAPLPPVAEWPLAEAYTLEQGVDWQKLKDFGWKATLGGIEQQGIPSGLNPATVRSHPNAIHGMPWSVNKQSWSVGKLVLPLFKNHITMTQFELDIDPTNGSAVFSAKGVAYVKQ